MQMEGREGTETPAEQRDGAREAQPRARAAAVPGSAFCVPETVVETVRRTKRCLRGSVVFRHCQKSLLQITCSLKRPGKLRTQRGKDAQGQEIVTQEVLPSSSTSQPSPASSLLFIMGCLLLLT